MFSYTIELNSQQRIFFPSSVYPGSGFPEGEDLVFSPFPLRNILYPVNRTYWKPCYLVQQVPSGNSGR